MSRQPPPRLRPLTAAETALARQVFGDAIDLDRVRIVRRGRGRIAFVVGSWVVFPAMAPADFGAAEPWMQAWLVHELTHVWQFQTRLLRTLASWLGILVTGGYGPRLKGYRYALPLKGWDAHNIEQQARIVEHGFLAACGHASPAMPEGACLDDYRRCTPFTPPPGRVSSGS